MRNSSRDEVLISYAISPNAKLQLSSAQPMDLARSLATLCKTSNPERYLRDRAVGAVLVSAEGELLAQAYNSNHSNRTLHAEVRLLQDWGFRTGGAPIPAGAQLFVTLKPCKMCAGMLFYCAENPSTLQIWYDQFDPGPHARATILESQTKAFV